MWRRMDKGPIKTTSTENGLQWEFGPGDSPWYQGAAESLIKTVKRCFKFSMSNRRLSPTEFLTICTEAANTLNERPLGLLPDSDSEINILTPNCQLIGRPFIKNPGSWNTDYSLRGRLALVNTVSDDFWRKWTELYAPTLIHHQKWHTQDETFRWEMS